MNKQSYIEAMAGTSVILLLLAALSMTAIVVGARYRPADQNLSDNYCHP